MEFAASGFSYFRQELLVGVSLANVRRGVSANSGVCFTHPGPVGWLLRLAQMWEAEVEIQMTEKLKRELILYSSDWGGTI